MKTNIDYYKQAITIISKKLPMEDYYNTLIEIAIKNPKAVVEAYYNLFPDMVLSHDPHYRAIKAIYNGRNKVECVKKYREITGT